MKRHFLAAMLLVIAAALPAAADTTETWSAATGDWSNAANWTPAVVPNNSGPNLYDVAISSGTTTLDMNPTIQQLDLSGGSLTGALTALTLNDVFTWTGAQWGRPAAARRSTPIMA